MLLPKLFRRSALCLASILVSVAALADEQTQSTQTRPHGDISEISDWALAGVVWSDASFAKKMAVSAAKQTTANDQLAKLHSEIQRFDKIIAAMEQFGWRQIQNVPAASPPSTPATRSNPTTGVTPSASGVEAPYDESVKIAEEIDRGAEDGLEGPAIAQNLRDSTGLAERNFSRRDAETISDSSPYSRNSLYQIDNYDPSAVSSVSNSQQPLRQSDPTNNAVTGIAEQEVNRLRASENQMLNNMDETRLPSTNISHFTTTDDELQADANWVQLHVDTNQLIWNTIGNAKINPGMLVDAINQLNARMQLAARITKNEQLRAALKQ